MYFEQSIIHFSLMKNSFQHPAAWMKCCLLKISMGKQFLLKANILTQMESNLLETALM